MRLPAMCHGAPGAAPLDRRHPGELAAHRADAEDVVALHHVGTERDGALGVAEGRSVDQRHQGGGEELRGRTRSSAASSPGSAVARGSAECAGARRPRGRPCRPGLPTSPAVRTPSGGPASACSTRDSYAVAPREPIGTRQRWQGRDELVEQPLSHASRRRRSGLHHRRPAPAARRRAARARSIRPAPCARRGERPPAGATGEAHARSPPPPSTQSRRVHQARPDARRPHADAVEHQQQPAVAPVVAERVDQDRPGHRRGHCSSQMRRAIASIAMRSRRSRGVPRSKARTVAANGGDRPLAPEQRRRFLARCDRRGHQRGPQPRRCRGSRSSGRSDSARSTDGRSA